jgi:hypothetical protein
MADPKETIVGQTEILDRAISRKWNKFTWSGLILIGCGLIVIAFGLLLRMGAYSPEGLAIGLGAIVVLVGIVRLLIGLINPLAPSDLRHIAAPHEPTDKEILEATLEGE